MSKTTTTLPTTPAGASDQPGSVQPAGSAVLDVMLRIAKEVGATSVTIANRESEVPYEPPQMADYRRECAEANSRLLRRLQDAPARAAMLNNRGITTNQ